jgi:GNAT superfamily N-acetyltransferase
VPTDGVTAFVQSSEAWLTRALLTRHRRRGVASFLHVSEGNAGARRLYESMGFVTRASLPMCKVERAAEHC